MPEKYDIIIIGGGISGLYMAYKCLQKHKTVLIIEKEDRLGGRIYTKQLGIDNIHYDAGAGRISNNHHRVLSLIKTLKVATNEITPSKIYRNINLKDGSVEIKKDTTSTLINEVINTVKDKAKYTTTYLQSTTFQVLCNDILGYDKAQQLRNMFGYDGEFKYCNAYDAIRMFTRDFQRLTTYRYLVNGMEDLITSLLQYLQPYIESGKLTIKKNTPVKSFAYIDSIYHVHSKSKTVTSKVLICALPQKALLEIDGWTPKEQSLFRDSVSGISLHRIFCQFPHDTPNNWVVNINRTITNDAIRQIIPMNPQKGFIQISYSDTHYADYWNHYAKQSKTALIKELLIHLNIVFPELKSKITPPKFIDSAYWPEGVHMWKPKINSNKMYKTILQPDKTVPLFIIGEAFSKDQCWIEGALETVDDIFKTVMKSFKD